MPVCSARPSVRGVAVRVIRVVSILGVCAGAAEAQAPAGDVARGRDLAQASCGGCHAVGPAGPSAMPAAPPFRELPRRYPVEQLAEALAEAITTGHEAMPEFQLAPAQVEALIAYLKTLER
jgi:mono/diheme cytochrome c family protein